MKLITLNCPSCGGELALPDNLTTAHCMYCGKKLILEGSDKAKEQRSIERYREFCRVTLDAGNYKEAYDAATKILELDPQDAQGWISKAIATFGQATYLNSRFAEATSYLNRATEISGSSRGSDKVRLEWGRKLSKQWRDQSRSELEQALHYYRRRINELGLAKASTAMQYALAALEVAPNEYHRYYSLVRMNAIVTQTPTTWKDHIAEKLQALEPLGAKRKAQKQIQRYKKEGEEAQAVLDELQGKTGFLVQQKVKRAQAKLAVLDRKSKDARRRIAEQDRILAKIDGR